MKRRVMSSLAIAALAVAGLIGAPASSAKVATDSGLAECKGGWRLEPEKYVSTQRPGYWRLTKTAYSTRGSTVYKGMTFSSVGAASHTEGDIFHNQYYADAANTGKVILPVQYVVGTKFQVRARMNPTPLLGTCHSSWAGRLTY